MGNAIKIGWGKRSIAKEGPVPITGQFYLRISQGAFTPVLVSALVIENGSDAVIFASADMVSVQPEMLTMAQEILKKEAPEIPADKIIANATHTHAGPASNKIGSFPSKIKFTGQDEMLEFLSRQLADAVKDAWFSRAEGAVSYGYGFATTGHSRRTIYLDDTGLREQGKDASGIAVNGHGKMYGNTNDDMFDGYEAGTDAFINLLYTFDKAGKVTGAVINVPCPSQTNENAWVLHASFWHNVREKLTAKYGENFGVIGQAAAAGDLSPRQMHYREAEKRRYLLKYPELVAKYKSNPMPSPFERPADENDPGVVYDWMEFMRAEDIANRITAAFDEVLSWAGKEKFTEPELKHDVRTVKLARRMFPDELVQAEKSQYDELMQQEYSTDTDPYKELIANSKLTSRRNRLNGVVKRAEIQQQEPGITTVLHAVKIGNIAFASNRFELYMDFMHRIQARSPFEQTFIVQLVSDQYGTGSYLATIRGVANKGYSATPYCNQVSPEGGQELVNETLDMLKNLK